MISNRKLRVILAALVIAALLPTAVFANGGADKAEDGPVTLTTSADGLCENTGGF